MSGAANIGITPKLKGERDADIASRVDELLDLVRLDRKQFREPLSARTLRRPAPARRRGAGACGKTEDRADGRAVGALDPLTRDALGDDYRALHKKLALTTVMITHDMTEAILLADRIAVMREGRILATGTPTELAQSDDGFVAELLRTPRRQAERLNALLPRGSA